MQKWGGRLTGDEINSCVNLWVDLRVDVVKTGRTKRKQKILVDHIEEVGDKQRPFSKGRGMVYGDAPFPPDTKLFR